MSKCNSAQINIDDVSYYMDRYGDEIHISKSDDIDGSSILLPEKTFRQLVEVFYDGVIIPHEVFMTMWNTPSCGDQV